MFICIFVYQYSWLNTHSAGHGHFGGSSKGGKAAALLGGKFELSFDCLLIWIYNFYTRVHMCIHWSNYLLMYLNVFIYSHLCIHIETMIAGIKAEKILGSGDLDKEAMAKAQKAAAKEEGSPGRFNIHY